MPSSTSFASLLLHGRLHSPSPPSKAQPFLASRSNPCQIPASASARPSPARRPLLAAVAASGGERDNRVQELRVPDSWLTPERAVQESEWLRETLHRWLDDEYCPEPANVDISLTAARSYRESLAAGRSDVGEILLHFLFGWSEEHKTITTPLTTVTPKWEGGEYEGDDEPRFEALMLAMELGAEYVDIELKVADKFMRLLSGKKPENCKLIVSSHNYENTPSAEELANLVAQIQATGADIVKIATTATEIVDVARMFQILVHCQEKQVPIIGLVMNDRGFISRILCPKYGGYLTFGSLDKGKESAPAQPTAADLINLYNIRQIGPDTKVFGIIGKPVGHSKSPILHNEAFRSVGFNAVYVPFLVDDLAKFLNTYSSPDFAGFSCTIPHKEAAVRCCDEVDPIARDIGAVNTMVRRPDGKLVGYNTDYVGAISAIEDGIRASHPTDPTTSPLAGRLFVVIGAGGAGKALAYGAKEKGARVVIANRTFARAQELGNLIGGPALTLADLENYHPEEGMILANTTAIGMHPNVNETPLSKQALKFYAVVFDAVYTPKETRLLREAAECGATVVSGLEMFIRQAMGQFEHFTGMPAPDRLMRDIVLTKT